MPMNPAYSPQQAAAALKHITASCFITSSHITLPYKQPQSTRPILDYVSGTAAVNLGKIILVDNSSDAARLHTPYGTVDFEWIMSLYRGQTFPQQTQLTPQDTINLQFTSGTTSSPKAVRLSHWNILNNAYIGGAQFDMTEEDTIPCTMPLYHCGGLVKIVLMAMAFGACVIIPGESFNARATMQTLTRERCTMFAGVPTMLLACLKLLDESSFAAHDFSHIRTGFVGGSVIPPVLRRQLNERLHAEDIRNIYGMTELSPNITMAGPSDHDDRRYSTVGRPDPHCKVRIVARDDPHRTLHVGEKGEVVGAGMVMQSYWQDEARTADALVTTEEPDGTKTVWMRTGDEGMLDADGFLTITGRIKDIIIRGGENIYPPEIEDVLLQHPDVDAVAVAGLPDPMYGEVVAAYIVPKTGTCIFSDAADQHTLDLRTRQTKLRRLDSGVDVGTFSGVEVRKAVLARLSKHLAPKYVFWMDELPMTPSGKIEKYKLVKMGIDALSASTLCV